MEKEEIVNNNLDEIKKEKKKSTTVRLAEEVAALKQELEIAKNDYYKAYADVENIKKRLNAEQAIILKYRAQNLATAILPSIDNLERALATATVDDPLVVGVKMVYEQLLSSLAAEGITAIAALGQAFNPELHHALISEKVKGKAPGIVVEELQKGYMIKDRVLRHSLVKVSE